MNLAITPELRERLKREGFEVKQDSYIVSDEQYKFALDFWAQHSKANPEIEAAMYCLTHPSHGELFKPDTIAKDDPTFPEQLSAARAAVSTQESLKDLVREHFPALREDFHEVRKSSSVQANVASSLTAQMVSFIDAMDKSQLRNASAINGVNNAVLESGDSIQKSIRESQSQVVDALHKVSQVFLFGILGIIGVLLLIAVLSLKAHAANGTSRIDVITIQNGGTTVKSFAAPFKFNCSTNMTCSISGSTLSISSTGGGAATGYQTIQNAGASIAQETVLNWTAGIVCVDNAGATRSDCALANITAVSHKFFNSVVSGALVLAQPDYGDLTGTPQLAQTLANASHKWLNSYSAVTGLFTQTQPDYSDLTGVPSTFAPTAHNLLSASHGDTTAASAVRGDGIFAIGATPTWQRLAHSSATGGYFKWNGTDIVASTLAASGTGTPTACSSQVVTAFTLNADAAPTSTCTTITSAFTSGTFSATAHNLLSATHGDTVTHSVVLGDVLFGNSTPAWAALAGQTTSTKEYLSQTGTGTVSAAPAWAQVAYADLSGTPQLPVTKASVASNWLNSYTSSTGLFTATQPAFTDISGSVAASQMPALTGAVTTSAGAVATSPGKIDVLNSSAFCQAAGASSTTYTCNLSPAITAYVTGTHYRFKADVANTAASTINFNGQGAKTIKKASGGITTDIAANDMQAGQWVDLVYDGTNMQMQSTLGNASAGSGTVTSIATTSPITGGTITNTGTIACATCVTSAASLTSNAIMVGAGSQASAVLASLGTTTTVLHGNAAGLPSFAAVTSADTTGTFPASAIGSTTQVAFNNAGTESGDANFTWTPGTFMLSTPGIDSVVWVDGVKYAKSLAGINAAMSAACNGTNPGIVVLPVGTIALGANGSISGISNCTLRGQGRYLSIIQTNATNTSPVMFIGSTFNFRIEHLSIDGNRANNANAFDNIQIIGSSHIDVFDVLSTNAVGNGLEITASACCVTQIIVFDSEFSNNGAALPSANGAGIVIGGGSGVFTHILIAENQVHDNNQGIQGFNSTTAADLTEDIAMINNRVYANADEGIAYNASNTSGGSVKGYRVEGNEVYCNGWPANGTGFSANCTAGLLQTGANASSSGVGIDTITHGLMTQPTIAGNHVHDNVFDGVSIDGSITGTVNTSGTTVTWISGAHFDTKWKAQQPFQIGASIFLIASVASTTSLTLQTSPGTLTGSTFLAPSRTRASIGNNQSYNNGVGTKGSGFFTFFADANAFSTNIAIGNKISGFHCGESSFNSWNADKAFENGQSGTFTNGFTFLACQQTNAVDIAGDDFQVSPTQLFGANLDSNSFGTMIVSSNLFGSTAPVGGSGYVTGNDTYVNLGDTILDPTITTPASPIAGMQWLDANGKWFDVSTGAACEILTDSTQSETANNIKDCAPSSVTTAYQINRPAAAASGVLTGVNASNVITWSHSGDAAHSLSQLAKTAAVTTFTLCAATANTACGQAGQYRISYNFYGSGTACATVTAGSVGLNLTWTDTNAVTHTTISLPLWDQKSAAMTNGVFNFNTALGTESASGSYIISTNGTIIQAATTYTACTSGTGTYNLKMTVEQLQ